MLNKDLHTNDRKEMIGVKIKDRGIKDLKHGLNRSEKQTEYEKQYNETPNILRELTPERLE